jgi:hypothetical protein
MAALTASMVSCPTAPVAAKPFNGLSRTSLPCKAVPSFAQRTVSNGARTRQMLVWEPVNNKCAPSLPLLEVPTLPAFATLAACLAVIRVRGGTFKYDKPYCSAPCSTRAAR